MGEKKMIFVTVGSQKFQFNRLLKKIDELIDKGIIHDQVFAQTGASDYIPKNYAYKNYLDRDEFAKSTEQCDVFITHGGTGAIVGALKKKKKVIAVPRLMKYGEHVDDHQIQLLEQFGDMEMIVACKDVDNLINALQKVECMDAKPYVSNTKKIIDNIEKFLSE